MNLVIRDAEFRDYPAILSLIRKELGYHELDEANLYIRLDKMKQLGTYRTIVAEADGHTVGFIGLHRELAYNYESDCLQILALAVAKEQQGKGIGSRLLEWVHDYAVEESIHACTLTSNMRRLKAHEFYEHNGFLKKSYGFVRYL